MKNQTRKLMIVAIAVVCILTMSVFANANSIPVVPDTTEGDGDWSYSSISVPGVNGNGYSSSTNTKKTTGSFASFKCTYKSDTSKNFDARLVNTNNQKRSAWVRDLPLNTVLYAAETDDVTIGYYYLCHVSSDLLSFGQETLNMSFSADRIA